MTTVGAQRITSPLVKSLEDTWAVIRRHHPELPTVAFTLGSGTESQATQRHGHFAADRWETGAATRTHEVFIAGERLEAGAETVLATVLHEATHALANARRVT